MRVTYKVGSAIFIGSLLSLPRPGLTDEDFTARTVMEKMKPDERFPYIAGVVEGLAYARYARDDKDLPADKKTTTSMMCVYDWFYKDNRKTINVIYAAFGRYGKYPPGAIIAGLQKKTCGE